MSRYDPKLVERRPFRPIPDAVLVDTSVLIGLGRHTTDRAAFVEYVQEHGTTLYLSPDVVAELK